jgi:hypothetical protein
MSNIGHNAQNEDKQNIKTQHWKLAISYLCTAIRRKGCYIYVYSAKLTKDYRQIELDGGSSSMTYAPQQRA